MTGTEKKSKIEGERAKLGANHTVVDVCDEVVREFHMCIMVLAPNPLLSLPPPQTTSGMNKLPKNGDDKNL